MVRAEIRAQREAESNNSADSNEAVSSTQLCTAHGYPQNESLPQQVANHDRRGSSAKDVEEASLMSSSSTDTISKTPIKQKKGKAARKRRLSATESEDEDFGPVIRESSKVVAFQSTNLNHTFRFVRVCKSAYVARADEYKCVACDDFDSDNEGPRVTVKNERFVWIDPQAPDGKKHICVIGVGGRVKEPTAVRGGPAPQRRKKIARVGTEKRSPVKDEDEKNVGVLNVILGGENDDDDDDVQIIDVKEGQPQTSTPPEQKASVKEEQKRETSLHDSSMEETATTAEDTDANCRDSVIKSKLAGDNNAVPPMPHDDQAIELPSCSSAHRPMKPPTVANLAVARRPEASTAASSPRNGFIVHSVAYQSTMSAEALGASTVRVKPEDSKPVVHTEVPDPFGGFKPVFGKTVPLSENAVVFNGMFGQYTFELVQKRAVVGNAGERVEVQVYRCAGCLSANASISRNEDLPKVIVMNGHFVTIDPEYPRDNRHICQAPLS